VVDVATRPGGRTAQTRRAVLDAAVAELEERGVAGLSVAAVAARSGAHPSTIYRRWGTIDLLVFDALLDRVDAAVPIPDLGSFALDVRALLGSLSGFYATPLGLAIGRLAMAPSDDEAAERVRLALWSARVDAVAAVVRRAIERGELSTETNVDMAVQLLLGPLHLAMVTLDREVPPALVDVLAGAALEALRTASDVEA
jgi:AcrR family transcriptional regulator